MYKIYKLDEKASIDKVIRYKKMTIYLKGKYNGLLEYDRLRSDFIGTKLHGKFNVLLNIKLGYKILGVIKYGHLVSWRLVSDKYDIYKSNDRVIKYDRNRKRYDYECDISKFNFQPFRKNPMRKSHADEKYIKRVIIPLENVLVKYLYKMQEKIENNINTLQLF